MAGILQYTIRTLSCQSSISELRGEEKLADSVYQGIAKLYAPSLTPIKEYRSKPLDRGIKQFNRKLTTQSVSLKIAYPGHSSTRHQIV